MEETKKEAPTKKEATAETPKKKEVKITLKNTAGKDMKEEDYFFLGKAMPWFNRSCGFPVDREDLLEVFDSVFKPSDNILFYKTRDKEVYIIIIPLKNSTVIGESNNSVEGDFQKHAISFINEGSVNLETLRSKLKRIIPFVNFNIR